MSANAANHTTVFTGCNLYIQNGLGATNGEPLNGFDTAHPVVNGLGNLIIGYNVQGSGGGSHNLILGDLNSYSSYGGIVAGFNNTTSGPYAAVTGGAQNTASGIMSWVGGGLSNVTTGTQACISGGGQNTASGDVSAISGGVNNVSKGYVSAISGGIGISLSTDFGWAAGSYHSP